jgi:hypothetical protein
MDKLHEYLGKLSNIKVTVLSHLGDIISNIPIGFLWHANFSRHTPKHLMLDMQQVKTSNGTSLRTLLGTFSKLFLNILACQTNIHQHFVTCQGSARGRRRPVCPR